MVYAVCRLNLRDRHDAEDATQQTFLSAYRSLLGGREPNDPPAWLATIARNECSRLRRQRFTTRGVSRRRRATYPAE
jgi:DNA-directed RNA polymerase specialized sigma24 family protein